MAVLASLDTLTPSGKDSFMILATIELGRFKSSGRSAIALWYLGKSKQNSCHQLDKLVEQNIYFII